MSKSDTLQDYSGMTLHAILEDVVESRWKGQRAFASNMCQMRKALETVTGLMVRTDASHLDTTARLKVLRHEDITLPMLREAVRRWRKAGLAPVTVNRRVVCMSVLGYDVRSLYTRMPKTLKWWLKPDAEAILMEKLDAWNEHTMRDYIIWATHTGMRVEETLRLTRADFSELPSGRVIVTVPGLKTSDAQATLPLNAEATEVYRRRLASDDHRPADRLFKISYGRLAEKWRECRVVIGAARVPGATLKALRRVSARKLHATKGMPLDMVRTYLRHENIQTTMGYLRLTGGYGADEIERYL